MTRGCFATWLATKKEDGGGLFTLSCRRLVLGIEREGEGGEVDSEELRDAGRRGIRPRKFEAWGCNVT